MKTCYIAFLLCLLSLGVLAQDQRNRPVFSIGLQGASNVVKPNYGISGSVNALWKAKSLGNSEVPSNWVASVKFSQLSGKGGKGFFVSGFDKSVNENISTLSVMGGYRLGLTEPTYQKKPYETPTAGLYVELQAGIAFIGIPTKRPTVAGNIGYHISRSFELNASAQYMKDWNKDLFIVGVGGAFSF